MSEQRTYTKIIISAESAEALRANAAFNQLLDLLFSDGPVSVVHVEKLDAWEGDNVD